MIDWVEVLKVANLMVMGGLGAAIWRLSSTLTRIDMTLIGHGEKLKDHSNRILTLERRRTA